MTHPGRPHRFTRSELDALPLFAGLDEHGWERLLSVARPESPGDGESVQHPGRDDHRLAVVVTGGLRLVHVEPAGHARTVRLLGPGDHVGETQWLLRHRPVHSAFALPGTRLCAIPHAHLDDLTSAHPTLLRALLESAQRQLLSTELLLSAQMVDTVLTRLTSYLLGLPGKVDDDNTRRVTFPGSQVDVASYLGTTPETLSRRLRSLVDAGLITRTGERGEFSLDTDGLSASLLNADGVVWDTGTC